MVDCRPLTQPDRVHAVFGENATLRGGSWRRWAFPGLWLVYLAQTVSSVHAHASGAVAVLGYVLVAVFALTYLTAVSAGWTDNLPRFWALYALGVACTVAEAFIARDGVVVFFVFLSVLTVAARRRWGTALIAAMALFALIAPATIPGWGTGLDYGDALVVVLVGLAMYAFFAVLNSNLALAAARAEVARLAAENERTRIARDLHDLLGHSLTTITVKAGLARRLAEHGEYARATTEIAEVEALSRSTLADVRAAVAGHRDVTLAGELATAREVLRASGVVAELPGSVAPVASELSELFGWVVREAVTNVVRHARATHCTVSLGRDWIEVRDDGVGGVGGAGNGLVGLRERVAEFGGTVVAAGDPAGGWRVRVEVGLPARPVPRADTAPTLSAP